MANFSNAELAQKLSDLIDYWSSFNEEYANWLAGAVDGGPGNDGAYPLTDYLGNESLVDCPAKLGDNVDGFVGDASDSADAAAASESAASTSESNAATSATTATAQATLADADRIAAESAESGAVDAKVTAIAQAVIATAKAILTEADAVLTAADVVSTDADATAAASSASDAANSAASIDYTWDSITSTPTTLSGYGITDAIADAPINGSLYGRKDGAWVVVAGGSEVNDLSLSVTWVDIPIANVPTGTTGSTVALGNHAHSGVYEPVDGTLVRNDDAGYNKTEWDIAVGWGNHASGGYAASGHNHSGVYEPVDATLVRNDDSGYLKSNWDTAYGWGNHASTYEPLNAKIPRHISSGYNSANITVSASEPGSPAQGDIWFDTS